MISRGIKQHIVNLSIYSRDRLFRYFTEKVSMYSLEFTSYENNNIISRTYYGIDRSRRLSIIKFAKVSSSLKFQDPSTGISSLFLHFLTRGHDIILSIRRL